jgi:hypothetical protein
MPGGEIRSEQLRRSSAQCVYGRDDGSGQYAHRQRAEQASGFECENRGTIFPQPDADAARLDVMESSPIGAIAWTVAHEAGALGLSQSAEGFGTGIVTLEADFSFAVESLRIVQLKWEKIFGRPLEDFGGPVLDENLGNFQFEFDRIRASNADLTPQQIGDLAIRDWRSERCLSAKGASSLMSQDQDGRNTRRNDGLPDLWIAPPQHRLRAASCRGRDVIGRPRVRPSMAWGHERIGNRSDPRKVCRNGRAAVVDRPPVAHVIMNRDRDRTRSLGVTHRYGRSVANHRAIKAQKDKSK